MGSARHVVGIDLGTVNTALASVDLAQEGDLASAVEPFPIPQLVAPGDVRERRLLPSCAYLPGPELPEAAALQALTRAVVTDGTGTALRDVPGEPVRGKTGTAEYGTDVPPRTHAWFAGSSGDLAFAVLVEDGGFGGATAAPVAAELLRALR